MRLVISEKHHAMDTQPSCTSSILVRPLRSIITKSLFGPCGHSYQNPGLAVAVRKGLRLIQIIFLLGTSIWSMEQVNHPPAQHPPAHHTAAQVTNLSFATVSATKSLPSLSEASQEPIRSFVPSHVTSQPELELEQGSLTSLDRAEMVLDAMLAEQRRSHMPSTQVSSSVDDLLRQSTRSSAHTRDFGVMRGDLGSSLPHSDMVMSLPLSSRDVASVDSGRGSAPVTMGDSLRSSMANTSTSTRTVHRDDRLDSSQGHLPHPGRGSHVQEVHHLSSLQSGAGLKRSAQNQNQSVVGSGAHSQDTGSGSTTTHSSKEIERWLRGKSPFKDVDESLSTEEGGHSQVWDGDE